MERIVGGKKVSLRFFVNDKLKPLYTQEAISYHVVYAQIVYDSMNTKLKVINFEDPYFPPIAASKTEDIKLGRGELGNLLERIAQLYFDVIQLEIEQKQKDFELKNFSNVLIAYLQDYKTLVWDRTQIALMHYLGDYLTHNEWQWLESYAAANHLVTFRWLSENKPEIITGFPPAFQFIYGHQLFVNDDVFREYSLFNFIKKPEAKARFCEVYASFYEAYPGFFKDDTEKARDADTVLEDAINYGLFLKNSYNG